MMAWAVSFSAFAGDDDRVDLRPEIHGVFRGRWETAIADGSGRFQVRNARVSLAGKVAPIVSYFINTDLCDRGKFLFLDAYGRIVLPARFAVQVGQFRMPFGTDSFRPPGGYFFNNRSFIGKKVNNYRAVGFKIDYDFGSVPLTVQAGMFNPTTIDDHTRWVKDYAYAGRLIYRPGDFSFGMGAESIKPDSVRINLLGVSAGWASGRWTTEAEYMYRHYTNHTHKATSAWNVFASYSIPLEKSVFDALSIQARFDGMTALASGTREADGKLKTTDPGRNRVTVGSTLDYRYKAVRVAVRLNYEKYFYSNGVTVTPENDDRLSAELIIKF